MTSPSKQHPESGSFVEIATVRIELRYSEPLIWRQIEAPTSLTLMELHDVIQAVMGWEDCHLWAFTIAKQRYGLPTEDGWGTASLIAVDKVRLRDVLKPRKTVIDYMYDFGDSWEHRLTVTGVRAGESGVSYPRYIGGERNGPPEDCGGTSGFYEMIDAIADPAHPDHAYRKEWAGDYDPDAFDPLRIKHALDRISNRHNIAKARPAGKKHSSAA
jgi:hypothetical protein